ncbi:hypothetical protein [Salibacterium halotolerans]|uniref:Uncharacterized protein n=1 Tax=Salibacterium halotolerans TaxID=1884432 RepID=A0A1I5UWB3_9BACI|nr:hypothetical protein [Salibacterium halotolerans]SFP99489.1 hypothetical protein SAMN05518683_11479 [Salibacterium halotolerans]
MAIEPVVFPQYRRPKQESSRATETYRKNLRADITPDEHEALR